VLPHVITNTLEKALNTYLRLDPDTFRQLPGIGDQCVKIQLTDISVQWFLFFRKTGVEVKSEFFGKPDAVIEGKSWHFFTSSFSESAIQQMNVQGDVELGYQIHGIFKNIQIDWEEQLSYYTGDLVAHQIGSIARWCGDTFKRTRTHLRENITEYVQEESRLFPPAQEIEDFYHDIELIKQRVERLEAYLRTVQITFDSS
jgi:ubiquinone biosynthesis protein UbiJ